MSPPTSTNCLLLYTDGNRLFNANDWQQQAKADLLLPGRERLTRDELLKDLDDLTIPGDFSNRRR
jgi:hypothetical protein